VVQDAERHDDDAMRSRPVPAGIGQTLDGDWGVLTTPALWLAPSASCAGSSRPRRRMAKTVEFVRWARTNRMSISRPANPTRLTYFTSIALTTGPVPGPMRAAEDRPVSRRAYRTFTMCRSGTTESTNAIFILDHPPPFRWCDVRAGPDPPCKATRTGPIRDVASGSSRRSATAQLNRQSRSSRRLTSSRVVSTRRIAGPGGMVEEIMTVWRFVTGEETIA
jgi:hypothetical protein